jgi:hypothetical protein
MAPCSAGRRASRARSCKSSPPRLRTGSLRPGQVIRIPAPAAPAPLQKPNSDSAVVSLPPVRHRRFADAPRTASSAARKAAEVPPRRPARAALAPASHLILRLKQARTTGIQPQEFKFR